MKQEHNQHSSQAAHAADLVTVAPPNSLPTQPVPHPVPRRAEQTTNKPSVEPVEDQRSGRVRLRVFIHPGTRIEQYEIIRMLGRGGMGAVYLARDVRLGRRVAIKFLTDDRAHTSRRFLIEAQATARCRHPNIVVIHDIGEYDGRPYLVLEHLEGQTLREWMVENGVAADAKSSGQARKHAAHHSVPGSAGADDNGRSGLHPQVAVEVILPVVRALVHAHRAGIVHRDLKPTNIILGHDGTVKVLDFGIAKLRASSAREGQSRAGQTNFELNALIGTVAYMSPEQLEAESVDHRADLWAVGVLLYEMVVGHRPFSDLSQGELLSMCDLDTPMPSVLEKRPDLGPLAGIIDRCLIKDRELRTDNARKLLAELEALRQDGGARPLSADNNPFAGLSAFQEDDHDRFFGRDPDITQVCERLTKQPLMAVVAPSGLGKSSLIRAGVIPALRRAGQAWDVHIARPGRKPLRALVDILGSLASTREVRNSLLGRTGDGTARSTMARLIQEPGYLGATLRAKARATGRKALLFVDQFEELFTLGASDVHIRAFLACLEGTADDASSPLRVILCMRTDFVDRLTPHRQFMARMRQGWLFLAPLGPAELREALVTPVHATGHRFESEDIVTDMLTQVERAPGTLPLMQFAAARLWSQRDQRRRMLTVASYEAMGGLAGTLASHAERVIAGMNRAEFRRARVLFKRLVTSEQTRAVVGINDLYQLDDDPQAMAELILHLVDVRLLAIQIHETREHAVELIHESLITAWPRLAGWLSENREDRAFLERVRAAAGAWRRAGRSADLVWRGRAVEEARLWRDRYQGPLTELEAGYLDAVLALSRRHRRRKRALTAAAMVFLGALAAVSWWAKVQSERQAAVVQRQYRDLTVQGDRLAASLESQRQALAEVGKQRDQSRTLSQDRERALKAAEKHLKAASIARDAEIRERGKAEKSLRRIRRARRKLRAALNDANEARSAAEEAEYRASRLAAEQKKTIQQLENLIRKANGGQVPKRLSQQEH